MEKVAALMAAEINMDAMYDVCLDSMLTGSGGAHINSDGLFSRVPFGEMLK